MSMAGSGERRRVGIVLAVLAVVTAAGLWTLQSAAVSMPSADAASARYAVIFVPSWNGATHPQEYPFSHAKQGLLTPMIGATHGNDFRLFEAGRQPTPGLERLSEMGKHQPLDAEIKAAIRQRKAGSLIEVADGSPGPVHAPVQHTFEIDAEFSQVSLVGMIAPSPDWFYGVSAVALRSQSGWLPSLSQVVYAWDSGGDSGTTYMAADADLDPKGTIGLVTTPHFERHGEPVPVGWMLFKRIPDQTVVTDSAKRS